MSRHREPQNSRLINKVALALKTGIHLVHFYRSMEKQRQATIRAVSAPLQSCPLAPHPLAMALAIHAELLKNDTVVPAPKERVGDAVVARVCEMLEKAGFGTTNSSGKFPDITITLRGNGMLEGKSEEKMQIMLQFNSSVPTGLFRHSDGRLSRTFYAVFQTEDAPNGAVRITRFAVMDGYWYDSNPSGLYDLQDLIYEGLKIVVGKKGLSLQVTREAGGAVHIQGFGAYRDSKVDARVRIMYRGQNPLSEFPYRHFCIFRSDEKYFEDIPQSSIPETKETVRMDAKDEKAPPIYLDVYSLDGEAEERKP